MDIPPIYLISRITSTQVLYFKHSRHQQNAPPHHFVTLVGNNNQLIIVTISSQVEKISSLYISKPVSSLIIIEVDEISYLPKRSIINCNRPEMYLRDDLVNNIIEPTGPFKISGEISSELESQIKNAIKSSYLVKPKIIKALE